VLNKILRFISRAYAHAVRTAFGISEVYCAQFFS
jgi:hypothetical protein